MLPAYPPRTSGMAIASMVLGIAGIVALSCCCCGTGFVPSVLAVVFGHVALYQIRRSAGRLEGTSMAIAGLVCGYIGLVMNLAAMVVAMLWAVAAAVSAHHPHVRTWRM
jgi:uncharacterized membrane protein